jgi:hypothetical protein
MRGCSTNSVVDVVAEAGLHVEKQIENFAADINLKVSKFQTSAA